MSRKQSHNFLTDCTMKVLSIIINWINNNNLILVRCKQTTFFNEYTMVQNAESSSYEKTIWSLQEKMKGKRVHPPYRPY